MRGCTLINNDVFDIAKRLREIDKDYFVVYSHKSHRFEVHNRAQTHSSFCLAVPFDRLDCRTVSHVRRTRAERADRLFAQLEQENKQRDKALIENATKSAELEVEKALRLA